MLLLYRGNADPGSSWRKNSAGWERQVAVQLQGSTTNDGNEYRLQVTQLGALPRGETWIGPVSRNAKIGGGAEIANMPTSSGGMVMLRVDTAHGQLEWDE
jgi:hypothetical protein